jgi:hypothetical protein
MIYRLSFPETPPSLNRVGSRGGHWAWTRAKKQWQEQIEMMLLAQKVPRGLMTVGAAATMRFTTNRRRDEGNYRALIEKSLGDALVRGGWLIDDTSDFYVFGAVTFLPKGKTPETMIILEAL